MTTQPVKRPMVVQLLDRVAQQTDRRPTAVVINNASIYHDIDHETIAHWFIGHRMMLFYLPLCIPALKLTEIL